MKNRTKLPNIYLGVVLALMYVPILVVILYSFNESRISSVWGGLLFEVVWGGSSGTGLRSRPFGGLHPAGGDLQLLRRRHRHPGAYGMSKVKFPLKGARWVRLHPCP